MIKLDALFSENQDVDFILKKPFKKLLKKD